MIGRYNFKYRIPTLLSDTYLVEYETHNGSCPFILYHESYMLEIPGLRFFNGHELPREL